MVQTKAIHIKLFLNQLTKSKFDQIKLHESSYKFVLCNDEAKFVYIYSLDL